MNNTIKIDTRIPRGVLCIGVSIAIVFYLIVGAHAEPLPSLTMEEAYPDLARGVLKSGRLISLDDGLVLTAGNVRIDRFTLDETISTSKPELREQMQKNLLFVLEQYATRKLLFHEAYAAGYRDNEPEEKIIMKYLVEKAAGVTVSEEEVSSFYAQAKDSMGGVPFEQVKEILKQHLLQQAQQRAIRAHVLTVGQRFDIRIDAEWVKAQSLLARDNPVDRARGSGRPTMVEFGATGCIPCDMMQPILANLRKKYTDRLNVVFVHVGQEQILGARYGIQSIPVQAFFDAAGREVFRHTGFYPQVEIEKKLSDMGVR